jgi:hypothetical protein
VTDPDLTVAPPAVRALASCLAASGFAVVADTGGGPVNRVVELDGPGCGVRITADRGQWWVELGRPPEVGWYDADVWEACLDDRPIGGDPSPLDEQVAFVRRRRADIADAAPAIDGCLSRTHARRARARLGLPREDGWSGR